MKELINPYANALDGLEINNPVTAFFNFCKEREKIRLKRESGTAFPWTDDPIFQKGRFLNVFREDDRGSKAILKFANNLDKDLPTLIHALFFLDGAIDKKFLINFHHQYYLSHQN